MVPVNPGRDANIKAWSWRGPLLLLIGIVIAIAIMGAALALWLKGSVC